MESPFDAKVVEVEFENKRIAVNNAEWSVTVDIPEYGQGTRGEPEATIHIEGEGTTLEWEYNE